MFSVRRLLPLAAAYVLAGCAASGSMVPEAEPLAPAAVEGVDGLIPYLEASGVEILDVVSDQDLVRPRVVQSTFLDFGNRGACNVLTYESAEAAEEIGPRSSDEGAGNIRRSPPASPTNQNLWRGRPRAPRDAFNPSYRFGPLVVLCSPQKDPLVHRALRNLEAYARAGA